MFLVTGGNVPINRFHAAVQALRHIERHAFFDSSLTFASAAAAPPCKASDAAALHDINAHLTSCAQPCVNEWPHAKIGVWLAETVLGYVAKLSYPRAASGTRDWACIPSVMHCSKPFRHSRNTLCFLSFDFPLCHLILQSLHLRHVANRCQPTSVSTKSQLAHNPPPRLCQL